MKIFTPRFQDTQINRVCCVTFSGQKFKNGQTKGQIQNSQSVSVCSDKSVIHIHMLTLLMFSLPKLICLNNCENLFQ